MVSIDTVMWSRMGCVYWKPSYQKHAEKLSCGVDSYCHVVANGVLCVFVRIDASLCVFVRYCASL